MNDHSGQKDIGNNSSLRGKVFHSIREDILSGKFAQKEELKEKTIGEELGVSRTPVREALRQLELEGLVSIIPNKGAYVNGITQKDVQDIYMIRSMLEGLCARWAAELATKTQIEELEEIVFLTDFHVQKENYDQVLELDNKFHEVLYQASKSKVLDHVLSDYHHYVQRVRKMTLSMPGRAPISNQEHRLIVEAMKEKDRIKAEMLANQHMLNTIKNIGKLGWDNILK